MENSAENPKRRGKLLRGGQLGNKGGTGRPPNWFREEMGKALDRAQAAKVVQQMMAKGTDSNKLKAIQFAAEMAYGKPRQGVELTGADSGPVNVTVTHRIVDPDAAG